MAIVLTILNFIRLVPWKGIQLLVQSIINAFAVKKCDSKILQKILKLNALYVIVMLIRQIFDIIMIIIGRKKR